MTKATMIALVGEQPLPNFLPVREFDYSHVLLVYTSTPVSEKHYHYLREKLEVYATVYDLRTVPYNIEEIIKDLHNKLNSIEGMAPAPFIFNLTGGTKPMSLAAYQVAMQRNAEKHDTAILYLQSEEGESVIDYYSWQDHQPILQNQAEVRKCISLQEMLEIHLGPMSEKRGDNKWRKEVEVSDTQNFGHLFEEAIAKALNEEGARLKADNKDGYEATYRIKDPDEQIDIDIAVVYRNQLAIIEAKTFKENKNVNLEGFLQLNTCMRYLKGTYIKPFLVVNRPVKSTESIDKICKKFEIPIIQLLDYRPGEHATSLSEDDKKILLDKIGEVMKAH